MNASQKQDEPIVCRVRVRGILDEDWSEWLGGLEITALDSGATLLAGLVRDQAALHGLLNRIRDLGASLLSVETEA